MICRLVVAAALMELMELILLDVLVVLGKTPMFSLSSWLALLNFGFAAPALVLLSFL